jgi:hypothetical protein
MNIIVQLVTVYQVVRENDDGRETLENVFFEQAEDALERSKRVTWAGKGRPSKAMEAVRFPDGTIRLLGETIIQNSANEEAEKTSARAKLTARERKLLGVD